MQVAAGCEPLRELVHERGLQQAPLVMALLRPRVGKEDVDAGERCRRESWRDDLDRVVPDHAHVGERERIDLLQQAPTPGACTSTPRKSSCGCACAIAAVVSPMPKPISSTTRRGAAEDLREVERRGRKGDAEARQQFVERARLRRRHPSLAQHVAADGTQRAARSAVTGATSESLPVGLSASALRACAASSSPAQRVLDRQRLARPSTSPSRPTMPQRAERLASLRTPSRVTRHTMTSLSQRFAQKSAVTRRCRSGANTGSAGTTDSCPSPAAAPRSAIRRRRS